VLSHDRIWAAIDDVAKRYNLTTSGLARRAGLDPTTFNPSKRTGPDGRERWPSTESVSKILKATGMSIADFTGLLDGRAARATMRREREPSFRQVPLLGLAQAGAGGFFDDGGFPAGQGWDQVDIPAPRGEGVYALKVTGDSMLPLYRDGDTIIVSPTEPTRKGDRVVVRTRDGEVMAKVLQKKTPKAVELASLNTDHPHRTIPTADIEWIARIIWASQ
jgi:phage repressor protein C with HTH and peptisase S24 domain